MAKKGSKPAPPVKKGGKPTGTPKNKSGKGKEKTEKQIKVPKIVVPNFEVSEEVEIDDEDIEFFKENSQLSGFLNKMDAVKLAKNEIIKAKKKTTTGLLKKGPTEQTADDVESDPESIDSLDSDIEGMDIDMDDDSDEPISDEEYDMEDMESAEDSDDNNNIDDDSDEEQGYEQAPRRPEGWSEKASTRLPIKLADGRLRELADDRVKPSDLRKAEEESEEEEVVDSDFAEEEVEEAIAEEIQPEEPKKLPKKAQIAKQKEEMATMAQAIIADPEATVGQLKKLRAMSQDPSDVIKKLAMLTQLAVYKDILPGYRIRPLTEKEQGVTVSKDVAKLRDYEQSLLQNYQNYLLSLEKVLSQDKSEKEEEELEIASRASTASLTAPAPSSGSLKDQEASKKSKADLATVAIHCMCNLLTSVTHFNFRLNLMTALVVRMSRRHWSELSDTCSNALKQVFAEDESGEASLDAVKLITKMIKSKSYLVNPNVINLFLTLRLKEELPTRQGGDDENPRKRKKKEKVHISKKNRKLLKAKKEVETEMKEAEAVVDKEEKMRTQTETLKLVFVTYFRILKHAPGSTLLPAVLEGLAKFAHLINVDFFTDLIEVLKKIMVGGADSQNFDPYNPANRRTQLLCIVTAFQLLQGQGEALNIDLKAFYVEFYTTLITVAMNPDIEGNIFEAAENSAKEKEKQKQASKSQWKGKNANKAVGDEILVVLGTDRELILKGFELLFFTNKGKIPVVRSASFLKRISIASLQFPNKSMKDFLMVMKKLIQKQPQLDQLLTGSDEDRAGNGVYLPTLNDPELCNPMAASLWEYELMKTHFDPKLVFSSLFHPTLKIIAIMSFDSQIGQNNSFDFYIDGGDIDYMVDGQETGQTRKHKISNQEDQDQDQDQDLDGQKEGSLSPNGKKSLVGTKPGTSSPDQRKEQNRAAQRAFRDRKERYLHQLENTIDELKEQQTQMTTRFQQEVKQLKSLLEGNVQENYYLRNVIFAFETALCKAGHVAVLHDVKLELYHHHYECQKFPRTGSILEKYPHPLTLPISKSNSLHDTQPYTTNREILYKAPPLFVSVTPEDGQVVSILTPLEKLSTPKPSYTPPGTHLAKHTDYTKHPTVFDELQSSLFPPGTLQSLVQSSMATPQEVVNDDMSLFEQSQQTASWADIMSYASKMGLTNDNHRLQKEFKALASAKPATDPYISPQIYEIPHDSRIDLVPCPKMRAQMILHQNKYNHDELFQLLIDKAICHGPPLDEHCWELPDEFFDRFGFLMGLDLERLRRKVWPKK
ncbi:hypothetical protein BGZ76_010573 [Entomortierella beljakovae]|nr:hypothetical protein BGZ76_010573 [Entomortierella beljakovae]